MPSHVQEQIEDYLEKQLEPEASRRLEQHVERCPSCGQALRQARLARRYLEWLRPREELPQPGPTFYSKVQQAIEKRRRSGWWSDLVATLPPRLAYPLLSLAALLIAWTLTYQPRRTEAELSVMDFLPAQIANLSVPEANQPLSREQVMISLVDLSGGE